MMRYDRGWRQEATLHDWGLLDFASFDAFARLC